MASRVCVHLFYRISFKQLLQKDSPEIITAYRGAIEYSAITETITRQNQLERFQSEGGR
jgi:hypothetical protein